RDYQKLLLALVFTTVAHGFIPRSARETEGDPEPRFSRILNTIATSKYSIHDLTRSTGEGGDNLARFNMPLELGMAAAFRFERESSERSHRWLALVPDGFAYQRFVSDLASFDPARHDSSVQSIVREVSAWLRTLEDVLYPAPSALQIYESFRDYQNQLIDLQAAALDKQTWADILLAASRT